MPTNKVKANSGKAKPLSLRLRFLASGGLFVFITLMLVGYALDKAFIKATEENLSQRLYVFFHHALANIEISSEGEVSYIEEPNDPQLSQPGSGVYVQIATPTATLQSPSALGVDLPDILDLKPGATEFIAPHDHLPWYQLAKGIVWELDNGEEVDLTVVVLEDKVAAEQVIHTFRRGLYRWLGGAGLLSLLAQWLLIRWALRPLAGISDRVGKIEAGETRQLSGGVPVELEPLTQSINLLLASEDRNRKNYRHDLDTLAHGLKTPLAIMHASVESHRSDIGADKTVQNALADMQQLISRHLQAASQSTRKLHAERVSVASELARLCESLQRIYPAVKIETNIASEQVFRGDKRDLFEILGNLLDNACKYGNQFVRVNGEIDLQQGVQKIVIEDNGSGIAPEMVQKMLRRGIRGDEQSGDPGYGLGLSIVRYLIDSYQGDLSVDKSPLGGARITLSLPL